MVDKKKAARDRATVRRHLREFIAALDRRVAHVERVGEVAIAHAAAALRKKAVQRLAELEAPTSHTEEHREKRKQARRKAR
jgi:hypothetical protein